MKNEIIVALVEKGVGTTTSLTLDSKDAYAHYKFKKWLDKTYSSIVESQRELLKEIGIEDTGAFVKRIQELISNESRTKEEEEELNEKIALDSKAGERLRAILSEDSEQFNGRKLSYDAWHKLMKENECLASADIEYQLEGVLWEEKEGE